MNIPDKLLTGEWLGFAWTIWFVAATAALWRAPWSDLRQGVRFNVWLGMIVLLTVVWSLKAGVRPGLDFHFVGAALFTLCFGPWLAFIGLSLVLVGVTFNGVGGWSAYAINGMLTVAVGVAISHGWRRLSERFLPRQLFVYVFANGFFGAGVSVFCVGLASVAVMAAAGVYSFDYLLDEYLPYYLLLGFSEAWLTGMLLTLFVIYRPSWVVSFDDARYLKNQ